MLTLLFLFLNSLALASASECERILSSPVSLVSQSLRSYASRIGSLDAENFLAHLYQTGSDRTALEDFFTEVIKAQSENKKFFVDTRDVYPDLVLRTHQSGFQDLARRQVSFILESLGHPLLSDVPGVIGLARKLTLAGADVESYGLISALEDHMNAYFAYPVQSVIKELEETKDLKFTKVGKQKLADFLKGRSGEWITREDVVQLLETLVKARQLSARIDLGEKFPSEGEFGKYRYLSQGVLEEAFVPEPLIEVLSGPARARVEKLLDRYSLFELKWALARRKGDFELIERTGTPAPQGPRDFLKQAVATMRNHKFNRRWDFAYQSQVGLINLLRKFLPHRAEFVLAHLPDVYPSPAATELFEGLAKSKQIAWTEQKAKDFVELWGQYATEASDYLLYRYQGAEPQNFDFITLTPRQRTRKKDYRDFHHFNHHQMMRASFILKHLPSMRDQAEKIVQEIPESKIIDNPHLERHPIFGDRPDYPPTFNQAAFKVLKLIELAEQEPEQALHWLIQAERVAVDPIIKHYSWGGAVIHFKMLEAWGRTIYVGNAKSLLLKLQQDEPETYEQYASYIKSKLRAVFAAHSSSEVGLQLARQIRADFEEGVFSESDFVSALRELWLVPAFQDVAVQGLHLLALHYNSDPQFDRARGEVMDFVLNSPLSLEQKQEVLLRFVPFLLKPEENSPKDFHSVLSQQKKLVETLIRHRDLPRVQTAMREHLRRRLEALIEVRDSTDSSWTSQILQIVREW